MACRCAPTAASSGRVGLGNDVQSPELDDDAYGTLGPGTMHEGLVDQRDRSLRGGLGLDGN